MGKVAAQIPGSAAVERRDVHTPPSVRYFVIVDSRTLCELTAACV